MGEGVIMQFRFVFSPLHPLTHSPLHFCLAFHLNTLMMFEKSSVHTA